MEKLFNISSLIKERVIIKKEPLFKNRRDEIISLMVENINRLREGTKYKPITKRVIAIRANRNPFLKSDSELELVYKDCCRKRNYAYFFYITK